jgi:hypothetical protein
MSMKRVLIVSLAVASMGAGGAIAATVQPSRARLRHFICQRAMDPAGRAVSVTAVMRPIPGTVKMALRFELVSRAKGSSAVSTVTGGDLNTWKSPTNPTLGRRTGDVWILNKPVANLTGPATYHFRVLFRWTGAHNRVLAITQRDTVPCSQPELRPDLAVQSINFAANPTQPSLGTYTATIRNVGATAAGPFAVLFAPGGTTRSVNGLAAHSSVRVQFRGPACSPTVTPAITVDPNQSIDDANRDNNSKSVVCSASTAKALR